MSWQVEGLGLFWGLRESWGVGGGRWHGYILGPVISLRGLGGGGSWEPWGGARAMFGGFLGKV